ncbi:MAG: SUMF1/EgtB/PvdO family nonheme iron enzyme [Owenweeksia sp.]|nr:SUMF1/EgtB/PvdO family nonheme iron enzyme [Owenweeksia sp.]
MVSVPSFWIDQTEITNNEYRQFVQWVRDSILRFRPAEDG